MAGDAETNGDGQSHLFLDLLYSVAHSNGTADSAPAHDSGGIIQVIAISAAVAVAAVVISIPVILCCLSRRTGRRAEVTCGRDCREVVAPQCSAMAQCCCWLWLMGWCTTVPITPTDQGEERGRQRPTVRSEANRSLILQALLADQSPGQSHSRASQGQGQSPSRPGQGQGQSPSRPSQGQDQSSFPSSPDPGRGEEVTSESGCGPSRRTVSGGGSRATHRPASSCPGRTPAIVHAPPKDRPLQVSRSLPGGSRSSDPTSVSPHNIPGYPHPAGASHVPGSQEHGQLIHDPTISPSSKSGKLSETPSPRKTPAKSSSPQGRESLLDEPSPDNPHGLLMLPGAQAADSRPRPPTFPGFSDVSRFENPPQGPPGHPNPRPGSDLKTSQLKSPPIPEIHGSGLHTVPYTSDAYSRRNPCRDAPSSSDPPYDASHSSVTRTLSSHQRQLPPESLSTEAPVAGPVQGRHRVMRRPPPTDGLTRPGDVATRRPSSDDPDGSSRSRDTLQHRLRMARRAVLEVAEHPEFQTLYGDTGGQCLLDTVSYLRGLQESGCGQRDTVSYLRGLQESGCGQRDIPNPGGFPGAARQDRREDRAGESEGGRQPLRQTAGKGSRKPAVSLPFPNLMPFRPSSADLGDYSGSSRQCVTSVKGRHRASSAPQSLLRSLSRIVHRTRSSESGESYPERKGKRRGSGGEFSVSYNPSLSEEEEHVEMTLWGPPQRGPGQQMRARSCSDQPDSLTRRTAQTAVCHRPRAASVDRHRPLEMPPMEAWERLKTPSRILYPIERPTHPTDLATSDSEDEAGEEFPRQPAGGSGGHHGDDHGNPELSGPGRGAGQGQRRPPSYRSGQGRSLWRTCSFPLQASGATQSDLQWPEDLPEGGEGRGQPQAGGGARPKVPPQGRSGRPSDPTPGQRQHFS